MNTAAKADMALRLIKNLGTTYDINRDTQTPVSATPWKVQSTATTNQSVYGILDDFTHSQRDGVVVKDSDRQYIIAAKGDNGDFTPEPGDEFVDDSKKLEVIAVKTVRAGATDVIYYLHTRA